MKNLLLLSAVCACAAFMGSRSLGVAADAAVSLADLKEMALKCISDSDLKPEQLRQCCAANPSETDTLTKHKKFTFCMQNSVGILQSDGVVNPEKAKLLVKEEEKSTMLRIAEGCLGGETTDLIEKAHNISLCYRAANSTMYVANCNSVLDFVLS